MGDNRITGRSVGELIKEYMMGKLIGYSILKVDHPVAIMGVFERFNEARRKLEELSKNGGKYRIQEEWIGEPASVINKQR